MWNWFRKAEREAESVEGPVATGRVQRVFDTARKNQGGVLCFPFDFRALTGDVFVVTVFPWSHQDVILGEFLLGKQDWIGRSGASVVIVDGDEFGDKFETEIFAPLFSSAKLASPIIGYWQNREMIWIDYGYRGIPRMLNVLDIPEGELMRLVNPHYRRLNA